MLTRGIPALSPVLKARPFKTVVPTVRKYSGVMLVVIRSLYVPGRSSIDGVKAIELVGGEGSSGRRLVTGAACTPGRALNSSSNRLINARVLSCDHTRSPASSRRMVRQVNVCDGSN